MTRKPHRPRPIAASGLLLTSLLLGGCATEQALTEQTQPLQDQIARLERELAATGQASTLAAQAQSEGMAARQAGLERQLAALGADVQNLGKSLSQSLNESTQAQDARIARLEQKLDEGLKTLAERVRQTEARLAQASDRLEASDRRLEQGLQDLNARLGQAEANAGQLNDQLRQTGQRLDQAARQLDETTVQLADIRAGQAAAQTAGGKAETALAERLDQAERRLKDLSHMVNEAMALAAKEIFLASGKEAFTVTLSEDRVLYPQNDPTLDPRDRAKLDDLAGRLDKLGQEYHLDIQGHTDNTSTEDNNYNLGKARAEVAKRYLTESKGISINRMSTISYGANKPLDASGNRNRRIFIRVLVLK